MDERYCKPRCEYKDIYHINLYNNIVDNCKECQLCSLSLNDYYDLILGILFYYKICNVKSLIELENLSKKDKKQVYKFLSYFEINLSKLIQTDRICRACESDIYEGELKNGFYIYVCSECMRVFFYLDDFKNYVNYTLEVYNNFLKRFLQMFKGE